MNARELGRFYKAVGQVHASGSYGLYIEGPSKKLVEGNGGRGGGGVCVCGKFLSFVVRMTR